jgi:hypothetical protein
LYRDSSDREERGDAVARNFFNGTDAELYTGSAGFAAKISADPGAYGLAPGLCAQYASLNAAYAAAYEAVRDPATRTRGKTFAKNQARASLRRLASGLAKIIRGTPAVTDEQKIDLALNVRAAPTRIPRPGARPAVNILSVSGRVVSVRVRDGESPGRRGKPPGTRGANVYSFVGPIYPADPSGWRYEGATTKNKLDVLFPDSVASGTQVWICAAWFNAKAQPGPVSLPVMTFLQHGMAMAA